jgi:tryptophan halogenase
VAILVGNGFIPDTYDAMADRMPLEKMRSGMAALRAEVARTAAALPDHGAYLDRFCRAEAA